MIDISFLNNQPKEFVNETKALKHLFMIVNEIKQEYLYIKNNSESEQKNFDNPTKQLINFLRNSYMEIKNIENEDYANVLKTYKYLISIFSRTNPNCDELLNSLRKERFSVMNVKNNIPTLLNNEKDENKDNDKDKEINENKEDYKSNSLKSSPEKINTLKEKEEKNENQELNISQEIKDSSKEKIPLPEIALEKETDNNKSKKSYSTKNLKNPLNSQLQILSENISNNNINNNINNNPIKNLHQNEISNFNLLSKIINSINSLINEMLKGSQDSIVQSIKDLTAQKQKYKTLNQKAEKILKEIDSQLIQKKKLTTGDLNSYNLALKEKNEDKILNLINDFDETKINIADTFEEIKKLENNFNEIIKGNFFQDLIIAIKGIKNLKICFEETIENKIHYLKYDEDLLKGNIKEINDLEYLDFNKFDIQGILEIKGISSANIYEIKPEEIFPKGNQYQVNFTILENLGNFINGISLAISSRKKILILIQKLSIEISKNLENVVTNCAKSIKNLITPKTNLIFCCTSLKQMREFLKSCSELLIKKYEEFHKFFTSNLLTNLDQQLKDINSDENLFANLYIKYSKELNNFRTNLTKFQQNAEKFSQNVLTAKEMIMNSQDDSKDPSLFQKLEKTLIACINEDETAKENIFDCIKKFRKFFEEMFENLRKNFEVYKKKENLKSKEIKEIMLNVLKHKNKLVNHLLEFFAFKSEISFDSESLLNSIIQIFSNFLKENNFNFFDEKDEEFSHLVKFFYSKSHIENEENNNENVRNENIEINDNNNTNNPNPFEEENNFDSNQSSNKNSNNSSKRNSKENETNNSNDNNNIAEKENKEFDLKSLLISEEKIPNLNSSLSEIHKKIKFLKFDDSIILRKNEEYFQVSNISFTEADLKEFYDKLKILKSNSKNKRISVRNILEPNRKNYEDLFYYDNDEIVHESNYSCALSHRILLQGKFYLTNKKIVFHSYFNNSNLFGTTLIEIPKSDIIEVNKRYNAMIFNNSIEIVTKNVTFFFTSFVFRDVCYAKIREVIFGEIPEKIEKNNFKKNSEDIGRNNEENIGNNNNANSNNNNEEINLNEQNENDLRSNGANNLRKKSEDNNNNINNNNNQEINSNNNTNISTSPESIINNNTNANQNDSNVKSSINNNNVVNNPEKENLNSNNENANNNVANIPSNNNNLSKEIFNQKFKEILYSHNEENLKNYKKFNKRDFNLISIKDKEIGDIPLPYIYNILFNTNYICEELNKNKPFNLSLMEIQTDHHVEFNNNNNDDSNIPEIYKENLNNNKQEKRSFFENFKNEEDFKKKFLDDFLPEKINFNNNNNNTKNFQSYKYNFIHPILKKRFMGPSQLNIEDIFKIYFISPKCFIVDKYSYMSGFMYMDCFFSVTQYKFETDFILEGNFSSQNSFKVSHNTKLTISFGLEFVKSTMFKQKISDNAVADTDEFIKETLIKLFDKVFNGAKDKYMKEIKFFKEKIILPGNDSNNNNNIILSASNNLNISNENSINNNINNKALESRIEKIEEELNSNRKKEENFVEKNEENFGVGLLLQDIKFILFIFSFIILVISKKFGLIDATSIIIFLNFIGFVIIFEKINRLENRVGERR